MRSHLTERSAVAFGPFVVDRGRRAVTKGGAPVRLTAKAFDVLLLLADHAGQVVEKDTILATVWPDTIVDEGSLTFQISTLRKALGERADGDRYIVTVPGRGYQLALPARSVEDSTELIIEERSTATVIVEETVEETDDHRRPFTWAALAVVVALAAGAFFVITRTRPPTPARVRSIAVLPFKPLLAKQRDETLELGMADTLIAKIGRIQDVRVRPLSAVRRYGGMEQDAIAAGRALGVDAVLDGSISSDGDAIRVRARLLRVADATQLWEGRFDEKFDRIFAVQDSIAGQLVTELSIGTSRERDRVARHDTVNAEAYRAYLLGRFHYNRPRRDAFERAAAYFSQAVALDANYAAAYAGLADVYATQAIGGDLPAKQSTEAARAAAARAIALDPMLAEGYSAMGIVNFWHDWNWKSAEENQRRAIALQPDYSIARWRLAHILSNTGRHDEAAREIQEALRVDPLSVMGNHMAGQFAYQAGDADAAIRSLNRALEIQPDFWLTILVLGKAHQMKGEYDRALSYYQRAYARAGGPTEPLALIAQVHAARGDRVEARRVLAELLAMTGTHYVPPTNLAAVYTALGDNDNAFRWLERACQERDPRLVFLNVERKYDPLRKDRRFADVARCVNLP